MLKPVILLIVSCHKYKHKYDNHQIYSRTIICDNICIISWIQMLGEMRTKIPVNRNEKSIEKVDVKTSYMTESFIPLYVVIFRSNTFMKWNM